MIVWGRWYFFPANAPSKEQRIAPFSWSGLWAVQLSLGLRKQKQGKRWMCIVLAVSFLSSLWVLLWPAVLLLFSEREGSFHLTSLSLVINYANRSFLLKVMQKNPKPCAVSSCLNYLFSLCCLVLMTLLVKTTIKWLIGWCAVKDRLMLISHFYFIYQHSSELGQKLIHFKMFIFSSLHLHFQNFIHLLQCNSQTLTSRPSLSWDLFFCLFDNFLSFTLVIFMYILYITFLYISFSWV